MVSDITAVSDGYENPHAVHRTKRTDVEPTEVRVQGVCEGSWSPKSVMDSKEHGQQSHSSALWL
jgi:hypothetical protein